MNKETKRLPYAWELEALVCSQLLDQEAHDAVSVTEDGAGYYTLWYNDTVIGYCSVETFDAVRWAKLALLQRKEARS